MHSGGAFAFAQPVPGELSQAARPSAADEGVTAAARVVELRKAPDKDAPASAPPSPPAGFDLAALLASVHSGGAPAAAQPAPVEVSSAAQPSVPDEGVTVAARVVEHRTTSDKGGTTTARVVERRKAPDKSVVVATRVVERPQAPDKGVTVAARVVEPPPLVLRPAFGNAKIVLAGVVGPPPAAKPLSPVWRFARVAILGADRSALERGTASMLARPASIRSFVSKEHIRDRPGLVTRAWVLGMPALLSASVVERFVFLVAWGRGSAASYQID